MTRSKSRTSFPPAALPCPWLMFCHGKNSKTQTFYSASEASFCVKRIPAISGKRICASFHEWMVMVDDYSSDCFLLNIISLKKIDLPPWERVRYQFWILSAPPTDDNCIVGFVGEDSHSITFCRPGDGKWVVHMFEPDIGSLYRYTICKGEIYCHGRQYNWDNLVILDIVDDRVEVRHVLTGSPNSPLVPEILRCESYFIESCEEIFLIHMSMLGASEKKIRDIYIFKLDLSALEWVKVESLGDRTFFINEANNCMSCSATKSGILGNSIYFMQDDDESMYIFDVEEKCIYAHYPCPYLGHNIAQKQWVMPIRT
ncbi:hypothetical protein RHSIM_Rhsim01G0011100 [Rhododendron simsii]|uniref:KIB1-4 beta-propeller domain-containing protein n=1 Tax=Rhododendron simsii TaxID=118357 RepID=A0A834HES6_RHOSS|nr:hypothetical protein RHSIM_Rhsim01G0011100 [Rhododendron simsii]